VARFHVKHRKYFILYYLNCVYNIKYSVFFFHFNRSRLEAFEQTCSVDQRTSRCAGPPSACRESILGILGTMLRTNCACKDTPQSKFYDCMGWQRVFWFNSCVGKYNAVLNFFTDLVHIPYQYNRHSKLVV